MLVYANRWRDQHRECPKRCGFTLIETVVVAALLTVGVLALTSTSMTIHSLRTSDRERQTVTSFIESMEEAIHAFSESALEAGDGWAREITLAYGPGGDPGNAFPVAGLSAWDGQNDVCTVQIITDENTTDLALGVRLGLPRDLDGDGASTNADVSTNARLLPVVITARWQNSSGPREIVHGFYILGY